MHTLKNSAHIRTSRNVKSFCSCRHATGEPSADLDQGRMALEGERLSIRVLRRIWLARKWNKHQVRVCSRQTKAR